MRNQIDLNQKPGWIWEDYIATRHCNLIGADGGVGKSRLALWLAGQCYEGTLPGATITGNTLFVDLEGRTMDLMQKAESWGFAPECPGFFGVEIDGFPMPGGTDYGEIKKAAIHIEARIIVIDSWSHYIGSRDYNSQPVVISVISPLQALARECDAAVIILAHRAKGVDIEMSKTPMQGAKSIRGSGSLYEQCTSVMILDQHVDGTGFDFYHVKTNMGPIGSTVTFKNGENGSLHIEQRNNDGGKELISKLPSWKKTALDLAEQGVDEATIRARIKAMEGANVMWPTRAIEFLRKQGYIFK